MTSTLNGVSLVVELPAVRAGYRLWIGNYEYNCLADPTYPDRLFCQGLARPPLDRAVSLRVAEMDSQVEVYQGQISLASALFATPMPNAWTHNTCPDRGKDVLCEVECRIAPDGNPCIVASCNDACGPYFSVHTCPEMSLDFNSCTPQQWAIMKARYSIP